MKRAARILLPICLLAAIPSAARAGSFTALAYNVAGLPQGISSSNPIVNNALISPLLNAWDLVLVQEDFQYHEDLTSALTHPYRTIKDTNPGPYGEQLGYAFGDGLNTFSRLPFTDFARTTWNDCYGFLSNASDCLTPKGFSFQRHELAPGALLDVYNLHADAGGAEEDKATRRANLRQLAAAILALSGDNAVLVMGDTNSRYTRDGDILPEFVATAGLVDVWVELARGGAMPELGSSLTGGCESAPAGGACERVDKVFYRSSAILELSALGYDVPGHFVDAEGEPLSDHDPVSVGFAWRVVPEPASGLLLGLGLAALALPGRRDAKPGGAGTAIRLR